MDHETVLNEILGSSCLSGHGTGHNGLRLFELELHCTYIYIVARLRNHDNLDFDNIKYDILYFDVQNWANDDALEKAQAFMEDLV